MGEWRPQTFKMRPVHLQLIGSSSQVLLQKSPRGAEDGLWSKPEAPLLQVEGSPHLYHLFPWKPLTPQQERELLWFQNSQESEAESAIWPHGGALTPHTRILKPSWRTTPFLEAPFSPAPGQELGFMVPCTTANAL